MNRLRVILQLNFRSLWLLIAIGIHGSLFGQQEASEAKWRQALGGKVLSIPVAQAESVVLVTDDGILRSYSYTSRPLWQFDARGKLMPFVSRSREGTSYICRQDGTLMAVNRSGRLLWTKKIPGMVVESPLIGWDGRLFIPLEQSIFCISAAGDQRWAIQLDAPLALPPVSDGGGGILITLKTNQVLNISPIGKVHGLKLTDTPSVLVSAPVATSGSVQSSFLVYYQNGKGEWRSFTGLQKELPSLSGIPVAGNRNGSKVAVLLDSGQLHTISLENNRILWTGTGPVKIHGEQTTFPLPGKTNTRPYLLFDERGIYVQRLSGATGFTEDGRRLWTITIDGAASSPGFSDEGILYSGGNDWILYAYKLEDRVRSVVRSIYGPAPEGIYRLESLADPEITTDPFFLNESNLINKLSYIESLLDNGTIGIEEPESLAILMYIASSGQQNRGMPFQLQPPVQPLYRSWAIRLLARLGSRETIPFLTNLATKETDNLVVSEIATAIGHIGVDPEGLALAAFEELMHSGLFRQDERVLAAIAKSIGALCRFSGPPLSNAGIPYLIKLSEADKAPVVRSNAEKALKSMIE
ncbi:PQQ-binding-like beta-propeller repeat protein [Gracilinema caldarium]|uniref:Pyrrolo-quinoline quinone repeat-containing protein n=1 Tax=Gracilinema caldarium (strain ATCC 51460 / DSM 7334 / H1) TaxID=744872 RepID=F8F1T0_GRAC1|nr:PQQ-binding-like beta-propeller repeat protein [Gracilinema caldarium]AEJ19414.1 Pyrrolo-quinoline quinone repeat-containing protein [Gracilinema caldarium DSM 7334]